MPEKPKSFGKKLKDLFIVDENGLAEAPASASTPRTSPGAAASEVDDLIARYAGDAAAAGAGAAGAVEAADAATVLRPAGRPASALA